MRITTERLILREFTVDDWPDVLAYQRDTLLYGLLVDDWQADQTDA